MYIDDLDDVLYDRLSDAIADVLDLADEAQEELDRADPDEQGGMADREAVLRYTIKFFKELMLERM